MFFHNGPVIEGGWYAPVTVNDELWTCRWLRWLGCKITSLLLPVLERWLRVQAVGQMAEEMSTELVTGILGERRTSAPRHMANGRGGNRTAATATPPFHLRFRRPPRPPLPPADAGARFYARLDFWNGLPTSASARGHSFRLEKKTRPSVLSPANWLRPSLRDAVPSARVLHGGWGQLAARASETGVPYGEAGARWVTLTETYAPLRTSRPHRAPLNSESVAPPHIAAGDFPVRRGCHRHSALLARLARGPGAISQMNQETGRAGIFQTESTSQKRKKSKEPCTVCLRNYVLKLRYTSFWRVLGYELRAANKTLPSEIFRSDVSSCP